MFDLILNTFDEISLNTYPLKEIKKIFNVQLRNNFISNKYKLNLLPGMIIAGGIVCSELNQLKTKSNDIDIFMYGDINYENTLRSFEMTNNITLDIYNKNYREYTIWANYKQVQVILRKFKGISNILNGFDLDASQVAIDHKYIYFTNKFLYSFNNKLNIFNISFK